MKTALSASDFGTGGKPTVVISNKVHDDVLALLEPHAFAIPNRDVEALSHRDLLARCREAHALIAFMPDWVDEAFVQECPQLRVIACALKGYDNFDLAACERRGIWVTVAADLLTVPTAELAVALMLGVARHVRAGDDYVRAGWFKGWRPMLYGVGLHRATVGIIGMGKVGHALAQRLRGFEVKILYEDPYPLAADLARSLNAARVERDELLAHSDFVLPLVPLTGATRGMIGAAALARMRPHAILVNVGRGSVVDEEAVAQALAAGRLGAYAADVFAMEDWMLADRPRSIPGALIEMGHKTLFTPHLGSAVANVRKQIELDAASNVLEVLSGRLPHGAINRPIARLSAQLQPLQ